jgi:lipoprotein-anchoring transpeptidase ErfK/SrfK
VSRTTGVPFRAPGNEAYTAHLHGSAEPGSASGRPAWARVRRQASVLAAAATLCLSLVVAACGPSAAPPASPSPSPSPVIPTAHISIKPGGGSQSARPQKGITVRVHGGTLVKVAVRTSGDAVTGELDSSATSWHSQWALNTDTRYTVTATALDAAGRTVTKTGRFHTLKPRTTFTAQIFQGQGLTYGVGMPVMLQFNKPITNKKDVEQSLHLWASKSVVGAWYWDNSSTLYFRPRAYWPQQTKVRFVGHLDGVEGASGVYGVHTLRQDFKIGESVVAVASTTAHHVRIYKNRRLWATWPISTGRPGKDTPNGTYLTIEKENPARMVGPDYDIQVPWSVLFTWSGNYMHDASWSVGVQGYANVSHGCVNLSPEHAQTYYELAVPGDPVTVTGSPRAGKWGDGWTVWFLSWSELLHGSAMHKAVKLGPRGSTFVAPSSLPKSKAKAPVGAPKVGNSRAS